jgi:hypothetical protein
VTEKIFAWDLGNVIWLGEEEGEWRGENGLGVIFG